MMARLLCRFRPIIVDLELAELFKDSLFFEDNGLTLALELNGCSLEAISLCFHLCQAIFFLLPGYSCSRQLFFFLFFGSILTPLFFHGVLQFLFFFLCCHSLFFLELLLLLLLLLLSALCILHLLTVSRPGRTRRTPRQKRNHF